MCCASVSACSLECLPYVWIASQCKCGMYSINGMSRHIVLYTEYIFIYTHIR